MIFWLSFPCYGTMMQERCYDSVLKSAPNCLPWISLHNQLKGSICFGINSLSCHQAAAEPLLKRPCEIISGVRFYIFSFAAILIQYLRKQKKVDRKSKKNTELRNVEGNTLYFTTLQSLLMCCTGSKPWLQYKRKM